MNRPRNIATVYTDLKPSHYVNWNIFFVYFFWRTTYNACPQNMLAMKGLAGLSGPNGEWSWTPHDADWIFPGRGHDPRLSQILSASDCVLCVCVCVCVCVSVCVCMCFPKQAICIAFKKSLHLTHCSKIQRVLLHFRESSCLNFCIRETTQIAEAVALMRMFPRWTLGPPSRGLL